MAVVTTSPHAAMPSQRADLTLARSVKLRKLRSGGRENIPYFKICSITVAFAISHDSHQPRIPQIIPSVLFAISQPPPIAATSSVKIYIFTQRRCACTGIERRTPSVARPGIDADYIMETRGAKRRATTGAGAGASSDGAGVMPFTGGHHHHPSDVDDARANATTGGSGDAGRGVGAAGAGGGGGMAPSGGPPAREDDDDAGPSQDADDAPSKLLGPLEEWPDLLGLVLARLDPTDCALLAQTVGPGRYCSPRRSVVHVYSRSSALSAAVVSLLSLVIQSFSFSALDIFTSEGGYFSTSTVPRGGQNGATRVQSACR